MTSPVPDPHALADRIPPDFVLGVSTSAFQIEGATRSRGRSSWDDFAEQPETILDGTDGRVTADHVRRVPEDVDLLRDLGVDAYRFSMSWPRVQPTGSGPPSPAGIGFYDRLIDRLLDAGIRPMVTLFHFDTPAELEEAGGWARRDTAERFAEYARIAGEAFGDRVEWWVTVNEPGTLALEGYALDVHAPGLASPRAAIRAAQNLILGHGLAVRALRDVPVRGKIGISNVHSPVEPATRRWRDRVAAQAFDFLSNRVFADPVLLGTPPRGGGVLGGLLRTVSRVSRADLDIMSTPIDFYGLHYYFPSRVAVGAPDPEPGTHDANSTALRAQPIHLEPWPEYPSTNYGWPVAPEYLTRLLELLRRRYGDRLPPVIFTEGGASFDDTVDSDGAIRDTDRASYLSSHIAAALDGVPGVTVQGYFVWSLLDNFEWSAGHTQRFGIVRVDPDTQDRTPKTSYYWLQQILARRQR